jgi:hypothetical protein
LDEISRSHQKAGDGMNIKKYDRFRRGNEEIEATGLTVRNGVGRDPVFKSITGDMGREPGDVFWFGAALLATEFPTWERVESPHHPLCIEIARMFREQMGFASTLFKFMSRLYDAASTEEQWQFSEALRNNLSETVKKEIRPGRLHEFLKD